MNPYLTYSQRHPILYQEELTKVIVIICFVFGVSAGILHSQFDNYLYLWRIEYVLNAHESYQMCRIICTEKTRYIVLIFCDFRSYQKAGRMGFKRPWVRLSPLGPDCRAGNRQNIAQCYDWAAFFCACAIFALPPVWAGFGTKWQTNVQTGPPAFRQGGRGTACRAPSAGACLRYSGREKLTFKCRAFETKFSRKR